MSLLVLYQCTHAEVMSSRSARAVLSERKHVKWLKGFEFVARSLSRDGRGRRGPDRVGRHQARSPARTCYRTGEWPTNHAALGYLCTNRHYKSSGGGRGSGRTGLP